MTIFHCIGQMLTSTDSDILTDYRILTGAYTYTNDIYFRNIWTNISVLVSAHYKTLISIQMEICQVVSNSLPIVSPS